MSDEQLFDDWTRDYALLGLRMDRLTPGTVDAWTGPAQWREEVGDEPEPTAQGLRQAADDLLARLPGMGYAADRSGYLERQALALQAQARLLEGEQLGLREQARLYFDIDPEPVDEEVFAAAHAELEQLLPGSGTLQERRAEWRRGFYVDPERMLPLMQLIEAEVRARTLPHFPLPDGEAIEIKLVANQPWGAYNWYLGDYRSLIEINTDLPMQADRQVPYLCHEGYPGHHTEHATREAVQYRGQGQGEYAIQLINTPESLISEAIATQARELIFAGDEDLTWAAETIFPALGLDIDVEQAGRIRAANEGLSGVSTNASFMLHEQHATPEEVIAYIQRWDLRSHEEAAHHLQFVASPLWRVYVFTYYFGYELLKPLLAGPDRFEVFGRILSTPVYPSLLRA
jgi:hypothetical protein